MTFDALAFQKMLSQALEAFDDIDGQQLRSLAKEIEIGALSRQEIHQIVDLATDGLLEFASKVDSMAWDPKSADRLRGIAMGVRGVAKSRIENHERTDLVLDEILKYAHLPVEVPPPAPCRAP